jgi:hypothetical protein
MSTRANITFLDKSEEFYTIPVSSDGYPSGIGKYLVDTLKKTDCRSIRNNKVFLAFANKFVIEERGTDYEYEVDVSRKNFKIIVRYGSTKKLTFKGDLDEFAAWIDKD